MKKKEKKEDKELLFGALLMSTMGMKNGFEMFKILQEDKKRLKNQPK